MYIVQDITADRPLYLISATTDGDFLSNEKWTPNIKEALRFKNYNTAYSLAKWWMEDECCIRDAVREEDDPVIINGKF